MFDLCKSNIADLHSSKADIGNPAKAIAPICAFKKHIGNPAKAKCCLCIELFARPENKVDFEYKGHRVPIHMGDEISSLSAILLNDDYCKFILSGRMVIDDVVILDSVRRTR